jgi:hypothetical protein
MERRLIYGSSASIFLGIALHRFKQKVRPNGQETTNRTSKQDIDVGSHMTVCISNNDYPLELAGSITIKIPGRSANIHISRDLPPVTDHTSALGYARYLFDSSQTSLHELAKLTRRNDPRLDGVEFFQGISHLAGPLAKRLGFEVYDLKPSAERIFIR